jgi:hypothetical protein
MPSTRFTWRRCSAFPVVSATLWRKEGVTRFMGRTGATTLFAFSTTVQFSASAITTHTTPTLSPLHNTKIPVTGTLPPRLHIAPNSLAIISTRHAARRASPRRIICVSSSQGRKCSKPDCATHTLSVATLHHIRLCTLDLNLGNLCSCASNKSITFQGHAHGPISQHTANKRTDARKIRQRHGGRRDEVGRRARRAW